MNYLSQSFQAVALLSGGLDSLLAAKIIQEQNVSVLCLHFCTPFFGKAHKIAHWEKEYGLKIQAIDIGEEYVSMLLNGPMHGFGKTLNPCVDCKIIMMQHAKKIMEQLGAHCIISGEVIGQRPMSQRRESLNIIVKEAQLQDYLLRPLCALLMPETKIERDGIVDRTKLLKWSGRSRRPQIALAKKLGIKEIPTPAGGCLLAEKENARSFWPILQYKLKPTANDFSLSLLGRQFWLNEEFPRWLTIGRKEEENNKILEHANSGDILFKIAKFAGPIALGRQFHSNWSPQEIYSAAVMAASYSNKAIRSAQESNSPIEVEVYQSHLNGAKEVLSIPWEETLHRKWSEYSWGEAYTEKKDALKEKVSKSEKRPVEVKNSEVDLL